MAIAYSVLLYLWADLFETIKLFGLCVRSINILYNISSVRSIYYYQTQIGGVEWPDEDC